MSAGRSSSFFNDLFRRSSANIIMEGHMLQLVLFDDQLIERRPRVDQISESFEWVSIDILLALPSTDFDDIPWGISCNLREKRADYGYKQLVENIAEHGILDPVYVWGTLGKPGKLANGHHRVVACRDLGYTQVPVTYDRWVPDTSGIATRRRY
jgi:ParB-like nuclease domain